MELRRIYVRDEIHTGKGSKGLYFIGDCKDVLRDLLPDHAGRIKLIYMDPPYLTGDRFYMRLRVGQQSWEKGRPGMLRESFADPKDREKYLADMRGVLADCRELLREDGMLFCHVDYRLQPHLRLLLDEIFGEENFLNEIIWVYQTGGRSTRHFSRKHDVILFYAKSDRYDFDLDAVKAPPKAPRTNHMRRHVDPDGRTYRSMKVGDKVYTYYDDDPVAPSDVWDDVSHLQQRDPERTGYDTQKPLSLLNRIVRCASRPGEWVLDPFAGSGTTLEAARLGGRSFIGIDRQPMTVNIARRRLNGADWRVADADNARDVAPVCAASVMPGAGFYHVTLDRFEVDVPGLPADAGPMDAVDNWSVGYVRDGDYHVMEDYVRTRRHGGLLLELKAPAYEGQLALCVSDILGRNYYYGLDVGV
ncbi:MAG: hypothetical protein IJ646_09720 [Clostridia bacterium]|nr:hypothetical protein [Clostridia bacterium]